MMKPNQNNPRRYFHRIFSGLKIRHKLRLVFLPIPLLAVLLIGVLWYRNALLAVRKTLEDQTSVLARNAGLLIEAFFNKRELEINSIAKLNWLESFFMELSETKAQAVYEKYEERFKKLLVSLDGEYFQITCFDLQQQPFAKAQLTNFFAPDEQSFHFETRFFDVLDRIGIEETASLSENQIYISGINSIHGAKALVLGVAVFDAKSERKIGMMTFGFPISRVAEKVIKSYSLGTASQAMIVDKSGVVIYHTDKFKINQNLRVTMPYLGAVIDPLLNLKRGTASYRNEDKQAWIISYAPVGKILWSVGIASPVKPFIRSTERAGMMGIGITLGVSFLLLFLINLLSKKFVRDLSEVTEGARAIAAGALDRQIPVRSTDEIGELAADFNIMAADLKQLLNERQANEALLAVGKFSATLAHDLRNPVEGLKLLSGELCKRVGHDQQEYEIADTIAQSVDRLSSLVNQSLDFARLNQPVFVATDLAALADEVLQDFRFDEVELKKDFAHDLPFVKADAAQIKRVLANLIRNGLEACRSRRSSAPCRLSLTLRAAGEKVLIEVADNGLGIPAEIREKIFEPFFSTKPGGHGLGLALARQIISNHGGTIVFDSAMGQGTRFVIELPVAKYL
jgi:signal transduction histidine kinase